MDSIVSTKNNKEMNCPVKEKVGEYQNMLKFVNNGLQPCIEVHYGFDWKVST
nr:hypothetical protein [uncultured Desulfobacter sp.]